MNLRKHQDWVCLLVCFLRLCCTASRVPMKHITFETVRERVGRKEKIIKLIYIPFRILAMQSFPHLLRSKFHSSLLPRYRIVASMGLWIPARLIFMHTSGPSTSAVKGDLFLPTQQEVTERGGKVPTFTRLPV